MDDSHHDQHQEEDRHPLGGATEAEIRYLQEVQRVLDEQQGADFPVWFYGLGAVPVLFLTYNHEHHE